MSGGYRLNDFVAVEGGFRYADGFEGKTTIPTPSGSSIGSDSGQDYPNGTPIEYGDLVEGDGQVTSWSLGLRGFFNVSEYVNLTGKAGFHFWNAEEDFNVTGHSASTGDTSFSVDDDGTDLYLGVGGEFNISDNLVARAEYSRFFADDDVDIISGSVVWSF